ncbi:Hsp20/alpha crystallin family protein [Paracoccus sp. S1E-3]|uniref:Hsp20/alpha crystallin family protein n=1 Tax=Paracoccus sp. S1E-3 TaxID=2756130 RepID=UPI0015EE57B0|nr:Hsp20/alpha crystallin family protein [Paracoccus sp. S1E-3]MBA4491349.1 Hsp20/alpha crystallin family protein [Paracoccus sp. S1E-3]
MLYPTYLRRSDPFALMRSMMRDLDRGFWPSPSRAAFLAVNVWQDAEAVAVTTELPAIKPGDIEIAVKDNVLTISGERTAPEGERTAPEGARWHRRERGYGKFSRAIRLPFAAADDKVEAKIANGVLRIVISRPEAEKPKKIEIKAA